MHETRCNSHNAQYETRFGPDGTDGHELAEGIGICDP